MTSFSVHVDLPDIIFTRYTPGTEIPVSVLYNLALYETSADKFTYLNIPAKFLLKYFYKKNLDFDEKI